MTPDLDQIFRDNYHWVYRTAYGVTGRPEDAEDVLQSLFLRLLQRGFPSVHKVLRIVVVQTKLSQIVIKGW